MNKTVGKLEEEVRYMEILVRAFKHGKRNETEINMKETTK